MKNICGEGERLRGGVCRRVDCDEMLDLFKTEARKIWSDKTVDELNFTCEESNRKTLASLGYRKMRQIAHGNCLIHAPLDYTLYISPRLLDKDPETVKKVLIHEAIHIGYPRHDMNFRDLCTRFGGVISEMAGVEKKIRVMANTKKGGRYKTIKEFPMGEDVEQSVGEARRFAKQYYKDHKNEVHGVSTRY